MPIVSVTRFRVYSNALRGNALFFWHTLRSIQQARRAPRFLAGKTYADAQRAYWTVTLWTDRDVVRAFQRSGAHRAAMRALPRLMRWCDEAQTCHFEVSGDALPDLAACHQHIQEHGHFIRLRQPSTDHAAGRIEPPQIRDRGFVLRPRVVTGGAHQASVHRVHLNDQGG